MASVTFKVNGSLKDTANFLSRCADSTKMDLLNEYGRKGVEALSAATPVDSGRTAQSWEYEIEKSRKGVAVIFSNTNENKGVNIAIILQYGHGTGTGGYVVGRDYINPAIQPIFDELAKTAWEKIMT